MSDPEGLAVDNAGRLWVADTVNSRVLRFDNAATLANSAPANGVLGQPDFSSGLFDTTQSAMHFPRGVAADDAGRLWVADNNNNRVLRFNDTTPLVYLPLVVK
jgi:sugar lactone lactonase YvrE